MGFILDQVEFFGEYLKFPCLRSLIQIVLQEAERKLLSLLMPEGLLEYSQILEVEKIF